jgi:hypothetical protein
VSDLNFVGNKDGWICWICDKSVDPNASTNSDLGPSVDSYNIKKPKANSTAIGRLAHRQCNTMRGKFAPIIPWPDYLLVVDPAPIYETVERLRNKGGKEVVARCPAEEEANQLASWLVGRLARLAPELSLEVAVAFGGGQYLLTLRRG